MFVRKSCTIYLGIYLGINFSKIIFVKEKKTLKLILYKLAILGK